MAKGHFTKKDGGSKSGYDKGHREGYKKGKKDTLEGGAILSAVLIGIIALVKTLK